MRVTALVVVREWSISREYEKFSVLRKFVWQPYQAAPGIETSIYIVTGECRQIVVNELITYPRT